MISLSKTVVLFSLFGMGLPIRNVMGSIDCTSTAVAFFQLATLATAGLWTREFAYLHLLLIRGKLGF